MIFLYYHQRYVIQKLQEKIVPIINNENDLQVIYRRNKNANAHRYAVRGKKERERERVIGRRKRKKRWYTRNNYTSEGQEIIT